MKSPTFETEPSSSPPIDHGGSIGQRHSDPDETNENKRKNKRKMIGIIMVVIVCASQVGSAMTSQLAVQEFHAPFFLMWIHTLMMVTMWPLGVILALAMPGVFHRSGNEDENASEDESGSMESGSAELPVTSSTTDRLDLKVHVARARRRMPGMLRWMILFYPLWVIANYCYVSALVFVPASTMVSIFGSCTVFVVLGERLVLNDKPLTLVRVASVVLTVGGVVTYGLVGPADSAGPIGFLKGLLGVLLGTGSSMAAASYKVAFKKVLGNPATIDVCLFLSVLGFVNLVVGGIPVVMLAATGIETPFWAAGLATATWWVVVGSSVLVLLFNASIAFGIAVTSPLLISIGTVLTIPVTAVADVWVHGTTIGAGQIAASAAIVASFVLVVLFDRHSVSDGNDSMEREKNFSSTSSSRSSSSIDLDRGDVRIFGHQATTNPTKTKMSRAIPCVEQGPSTAFTCTPREAIAHSARLRLGESSSDEQIEDVVNDILENLGMQHCADTPIENA